MKLLKFALFILTFFSLSFAGENIRAQLTNLVNSAYAKAKTNNRYISLASQNKVLSQQIAKDAVKIVTKIDEKNAKKDIIKHADNFNRTINAFLNGNTELNVKPITNPDIKKQLKHMLIIWKPFYDASIKLAKSKKVDKKSFIYIYRHNEPLLGMCHRLTQSLKAQREFKTTFSPIIEHTLKFLDRERFLIPKMFKEKMLIFRKIDVKRNKVRLHGSFILFERTLNGLLKGDKKRGLIPVSNKQIRNELLKLQKEWKKIKDIYKYKRDKLSKKDMLTLNANNDLMLKLTDDLVHLVEKSLGL